MGCARKRQYAFPVLNFQPFHDYVLFFGIQVWSNRANGFNAAASMSMLDHVIGIITMHGRPGTPTAFNGRGGMNQYSVHVKEDCTGKKDHLSEYQVCGLFG